MGRTGIRELVHRPAAGPGCPGFHLHTYSTISRYLRAVQDRQRGLELGEMVLRSMESYPPETIAGPLGLDLFEVINDIGLRQRSLEQFGAAEASHRKSLETLLANRSLAGAGLKRLSAIPYHNLGIVAQEQRQWAQAEEYYHKALEIYIEFNDRYSQAGTYNELGIVAEEQRQWAQAEEYYHKALEIKIEFADRYSQAKTYNGLGMVAQKQRQWAQAEEYDRKALEIHIEFADRHGQAITYHHLGIVAQEQQQWEQAEEYYRKALEIHIEFADRHGQARTYHNLGVVAQEQQQWAQALENYLKDLEITAEFNDHQGLVITLGSLAHLCRLSGDPGIPPAIAVILGITSAQVEELFRELPDQDKDKQIEQPHILLQQAQSTLPSSRSTQRHWWRFWQRG
jgi:tetratricopeptide (TPR) repeat protein